MKVPTRLARIITTVAALGYSGQALAQCATDETPGVVTGMGIEGTVMSVLHQPGNDRGVNVTIKLRNTTKYNAHILTVGNFTLSSSAGALLSEYQNSGLNICVKNHSDKTNPEQCLREEADDINSFDTIPPCGSIRGTMAFSGYNGIALRSGDAILNYVYKGIVRFSPIDTDPLLADKPPGPPHIVPLVFAPQPIH